MKCTAVLAILLIFVFLSGQETNAQSHDKEWGTRGFNDRQLIRDIVRKHRSFMKVIVQEVTFGRSNSTKITYIKCTDQYIDGNGGYVSLLSGGVGFSYVTLHFKSQRNHGFSFIVEIFGVGF